MKDTKMEILITGSISLKKNKCLDALHISQHALEAQSAWKRSKLFHLTIPKPVSHGWFPLYWS